MWTRALLLTNWYFPLRILRWQDAVKLVYEGSVDVLVTYDEEIRSPSVTWRAPAVVRLRRAVRTERRGMKYSRGNVYLRDDYTCQYCGERLAHRDLTCDHVVPRSRGGQTTFTNIVTACRACNTRKGHLTCDEAGMFPLREPRQPRSLPLRGPRIGPGQVPEEWVPFLPELTGG